MTISKFQFLRAHRRWQFSFISGIIRLVNTQLALYSHARCNPLNTPLTPQKTLHNNYKFHLLQLQISTIRAHICQVVICNIVVKADLGRSTPEMHHGIVYYGMSFGSHFGFFKKRWEFPFISEYLGL